MRRGRHERERERERWHELHGQRPPHWHGHGPWRRPHGHHRLQHQLFFGFGLAIVVAMVTAATIVGTFHAEFVAHRWLRPLVFIVTGSVLWLLSGLVSRRIARPLAKLAQAATEFGPSKLDTRAPLPWYAAREIRELSHAWNEMAERIETHVKNQRELLGAVSHELRTPLARQRVLLATLADAGADPALISKLEREVVEMDALVGELLAGARVDAGALSRRELDLPDLVRECVERADVSIEAVDISEDATRANADATLLARALMVLLQNAKKHGGPNVQVLVRRHGERITFTVQDDGSGFSAEDAQRAFEPFVRGRGAAADESRGVGLGLYLVRRIAEAHGGSAFIENSAPTRVSFTISRAVI